MVVCYTVHTTLVCVTVQLDIHLCALHSMYTYIHTYMRYGSFPFLDVY